VSQFSTASPKQFVKDISEGYILITQGNLRRFSEPELKLLLDNLTIVEREIRGEQYPETDFENIKKKNQRLQRIYRTNMIVRGFIKHRRMHLE